MATCPHCKGPLTDGHRCFQSRARRAVATVGVLGSGGAVGVLGCYALIEQPHLLVVTASAVLGALLARALREALNPRG
jgi:hypothetical protein